MPHALFHVVYLFALSFATVIVNDVLIIHPHQAAANAYYFVRWSQRQEYPEDTS